MPGMRVAWDQYNQREIRLKSQSPTDQPQSAVRLDQCHQVGINIPEGLGKNSLRFQPWELQMTSNALTHNSRNEAETLRGLEP